MNETLDSFLRWFWVSAALTLVFGSLLWLVTRRRELWLRYIAAEAAFWRRLRVPERLVEASRRFEASRLFIGFLGFVVALWLLLAVANAGAYLYFKGQLPKPRGPDIPIIDLPGRPPG